MIIEDIHILIRIFNRYNIVKSLFDEKLHVWEHAIVQFLLGNIIPILIDVTHVGDRLHPIVKVFLPVSDYLIKNFDGEVSDHFSSLCIGVDVLLDESSVVVS